MDLRALVERLEAAGVVRRGELRGATPEEIAAVERQLGVRLPAAYRSFLATMGREAGAFLRGTDAFLAHLPHLRSYLDDAIRESGTPWRPPDDALVIASHQGYEFRFLRPSEGEDPPVYDWMEGAPAAERTWPSFSAYLEDLAGIAARHREQARGDHDTT